jgi:N-acetylneuraminic acid mutarotase
MIVVGGTNYGTDFADGAAYNPTTRTWRMLPKLPVTLRDGTLTWTGTEVLAVGGMRYEAAQAKDSAAAWAYNPSANTWRRLADMPVPRYQHLAAWAGNQLLVWGGRTTSTTGATPGAPPNGVAYDPATDRWSSMPAAPLKARVDAISAWTGTELLIWGGQGIAAETSVGDGAAFRPMRSGQA